MSPVLTATHFVGINRTGRVFNIQVFTSCYFYLAVKVKLLLMVLLF